MTSPLGKTTAIAIAVLWLTACATSPPSNYYWLTPRGEFTAGSQSLSIGVGPIEVPEYLNRRSLVHSDGNNQLRIYDQERWAEPLEDGILRVVGLNLANLLGTEDLHYYPWNPRRAPDYRARVRLLALDAGDREAILVAEWVVDGPGEKPGATRRISQLRQPLPAGKLKPGQLAPAYSELLYQLSEIIAEAVRTARETS